MPSFKQPPAPHSQRPSDEPAYTQGQPRRIARTGDGLRGRADRRSVDSCADGRGCVMEMLIAMAAAFWVLVVIVVARVCGFNGADQACPVERAK